MTDVKDKASSPGSEGSDRNPRVDLKKFRAQIAHIKEHEDKFNALFPAPPRSVEDYLTRHGGLHHTELYKRICEKIGVEPK